MSLRSRLASSSALRMAIAILAVVVIAFSIHQWSPDSGADNASVFPRLTLQEFLTCQRATPQQALLCLAGRCQGDWRRLPEPVRHVWVTLKHEMTGEQPENPVAPTTNELAAAYAALGLGALERTSKNLQDRHAEVAAARERYIVAHVSVFTPLLLRD